jgi:hypothetical protein
MTGRRPENPQNWTGNTKYVARIVYRSSKESSENYVKETGGSKMQNGSKLGNPDY